MRKFLLMIMITCQLHILSACWGFKEIQSQTYVTGIGVDYSEGEFLLYLQALNFANVARQEGSASLQQPIPIFIGEAKGKSIQEAFSKLEQRAALPLYYGHVETILLSESVIEGKMKSIIEYLGQNHYVRYNCWLFGTNHEIKDIFSSESFFNFPSLYTIYHNPEQLTERNFIIPIEKYNHFISKYYQPVGSYTIPSIKIEKENFTEDKKRKKIATVTGGFIISQQKYKGWVDKQDLIGLKWLTKEATTIPLSLSKEKVSVVIRKPHSSIKVINGREPTYNVTIKATAILIHNEKNMSLTKIEKALEREIKNQVLKTIDKGEEIQADIFNISEKSYRYHHRKWDINAINSFNRDSIRHINIKVQIQENINYKR
jgi:Ger(x)C family germination protein